MGEMFKDVPLISKQFIKHMFFIILVSAPENMMMGAAYILNGIKLHKAKVFDRF